MVSLSPPMVWQNEIIAAFAEIGRPRQVRRGLPVYLQGDTAKAAFVIKSGSVELVRSGASGRESTHIIHFANEAFGFADILLNQPRTFKAAALVDTQLLIVPAADFIELLHRDNTVTRAMLCMVLYRNMTQAQRKLQLTGLSAEQRIVAALERFALLSQDTSVSDPPVVPLTHEQIGRLCSLSRQTVTATLARLADRGLVTLRSRSVELTDLEGLYELTELGD